MVLRNYDHPRSVNFLTFGLILFHASICLAEHEISNTTIKIVCSAALLDEKYEVRKQEYINAIERIKQFGFMPYIVESCKSGPTFLDQLSDKVWYAKTNDFGLRNKGVNEAKALLNFFEHNKFNDDDIILKITGRYFFIDDSFLRYITNHLEYDAFVKDFRKPNGRERDMFTACFAMKYKYFVEFLQQLDLLKLEREMICIEWELADYVALSQEMKICIINKLGLAYRASCNNYIEYI